MRQAANVKDLELPLLLPGIKINTSPTDFSPIEQEQLAKFDGERWAHVRRAVRRLPQEVARGRTERGAAYRPPATCPLPVYGGRRHANRSNPSSCSNPVRARTARNAPRVPDRAEARRVGPEPAERLADPVHRELALAEERLVPRLEPVEEAPRASCSGRRAAWATSAARGTRPSPGGPRSHARGATGSPRSSPARRSTSVRRLRALPEQRLDRVDATLPAPGEVPDAVHPRPDGVERRARSRRQGAWPARGVAIRVGAGRSRDRPGRAAPGPPAGGRAAPPGALRRPVRTPAPAEGAVAATTSIRCPVHARSSAITSTSVGSSMATTTPSSRPGDRERPVVASVALADHGTRGRDRARARRGRRRGPGAGCRALP